MGKNLLKRFVELFCYCGLSKEEYKRIKIDAYIINFNMWKTMHVVLSVLFGAMFVYTTVTDVFGYNKLFYGLMFVYSVLSSLMFYFVLKPESLIGQFYIYLTLILLFITGLSLSCTQPDMLAVTFEIILVVSPMFMIDKPYFMALVLFLASAVFLFVDYIYKPADVYGTDLINTICFFFLGISINIFCNSIKIKEITYKRQVEEQRDTDELTGLKSKTAITRSINKSLRSVTDSGVMMVFDIDHFKSINDRYGHQFGDEVLHHVGRVIEKCIGENDFAGRFGGDEFIIFLPSDTNTDRAEIIASSIISKVNASVSTPTEGETIGMCAGIALRSREDNEYDRLFKKADSALYNSKNNGRNRYTLY